VALYFVDTSGLSKRYVSETGSAWLRNLLDPATGSETFLVRITIVELIAAITRRERGGSLTPAEAATARAAFRADLAAEYQVVEVTEALLERATELAEARGLRAYDAVQLAAALEVNALCTVSGLPALLFISADSELNAVAGLEGLSAEDPNNHP
jgi:predicted nucleic acid-binding protein